jgi:hypothetical protein
MCGCSRCNQCRRCQMLLGSLRCGVGAPWNGNAEVQKKCQDPAAAPTPPAPRWPRADGPAARGHREGPAAASSIDCCAWQSMKGTDTKGSLNGSAAAAAAAGCVAAPHSNRNGARWCGARPAPVRCPCVARQAAGHSAPQLRPPRTRACTRVAVPAPLPLTLLPPPGSGAGRAPKGRRPPGCRPHQIQGGHAHHPTGTLGSPGTLPTVCPSLVVGSSCFGSSGLLACGGGSPVERVPAGAAARRLPQAASAAQRAGQCCSSVSRAT